MCIQTIPSFDSHFIQEGSSQQKTMISFFTRCFHGLIFCDNAMLNIYYIHADIFLIIIKKYTTLNFKILNSSPLSSLKFGYTGDLNFVNLDYDNAVSKFFIKKTLLNIPCILNVRMNNIYILCYYYTKKKKYINICVFIHLYMNMFVYQIN